MARTIAEIKKEMTDRYLSYQGVRDRYGLDENSTFEEAFSKVSLESIIFYVVASSIYVFEVMLDKYRLELENTIKKTIYSTLAWYHSISLNFQYGDELYLNEENFQYNYKTINVNNRKVKFCSCRDKGAGVQILVATEDEQGQPKALSNDVLTAFNEYINKIKPAGVLVEVFSLDPDELGLNIRVQFNPLLLNKDGSLIRESSVFPVQDAIKQYVREIKYGGTFNKTKLIDAIQKAEGVEDVILVSATTEKGVIESNNYTAKGGAFKLINLSKSIDYVLQL